MTWFKHCVLINKSTRDAANPIVHKIDNPENAKFQITDTKLYVPIVTLSKENDINLLEKLKSGFKRTIKWNKYRSQMTIQNNNNNLNYLTNPTFTNINRLFVLSCEGTEDDNIKKDYRDFFSHYYVAKVQIKDFNALIGEKRFFPFKNKK